MIHNTLYKITLLSSFFFLDLFLGCSIVGRMKTLEVVLTNGKPVFSWCPSPEEGAINQVKVIAGLPFVEHIAIMPDCHIGMDCPIGGVVACNGVIVPNFVGSDGGCGMGAFRTNLTVENIKGKEEIIHQAVQRSIPMGFSHNTDKRRTEMEQKYKDKIAYALAKHLGIGKELEYVSCSVPEIVKPEAFFDQMGTLGSGNHFIEVQVDEQGFIWVMVHSGSRNIGKRTCDHFNKLATELNQQWHSKSEIPFLPVTSEEGKAYLGWMNMCLDFAYYNRDAMLNEVMRNLLHYYPNMEVVTNRVIDRDVDIINIHHNYASLENHFGKNVWVHRKGATLASDKTIGIIPGSMGSFSYIVKGLGEANSLMSCSHGAGRRMGRNAFNKEYNTPEKMKEIEDKMAGVTHTKFGKATSRSGKDLGILDLSEAPQAYKDIDSVISNECDLVKPLFKLRPLISWKDVGEE